LSMRNESMGARESLQRLLDRKQQEIGDLEARTREAKVYVQALQDAMKTLPRESSQSSPAESLRPTSIGAKTRQFILGSGKPLHINEILKLLGRETDKNNRVSVSGTLAAFVRKGEIFTRPAPNTFGLVEMNGVNSQGAQPEPPIHDGIGELPDTFGSN